MKKTRQSHFRLWSELELPNEVVKPMSTLTCEIPETLYAGLEQRVRATGESTTAFTNRLVQRTLNKPLQTLFEISTSRALVQGVYGQATSSSCLLCHGHSGLQQIFAPDMTICLDMGSFHLLVARNEYSFRSRQVLLTNGQRTFGVALPWAIAATSVRLAETVPSISGDGGLLFSTILKRASDAPLPGSSACSKTSIDGRFTKHRF